MQHKEKTDTPGVGGRASVAHVTDDWYIMCRSKKIGTTPVRSTIFGKPVVIFRGADGEVGALLDRCPHRNVPLSLGTVKEHVLECCYHGWTFTTEGKCQKVPGLEGDQQLERRDVTSFRVREQEGFVWIFANPAVDPDHEPFRFPLTREHGYTTVSHELAVECSVHAAAENALDVPHTAYLHGGLFRTTRSRRTIDVVVRRFSDRVEAEYIGEGRPGGLIGRFLAPHGHIVTHVDRFILPSISQVEYRLGDRTHLCVTTAMTPVHDFLTHIFAVVSFRLPLPGWLVVPFVEPVAMRIFRQDAHILKHQTETIRQFGGEHFNSSDNDVLGPHIYRLLKQAERHRVTSGGSPFVRRTRMVL